MQMQMQGIMLVFVQVELYMAELYNKIGTGLITWSPISLGLCSGKQEDQATLFTKLALKVGSDVIGLKSVFNCALLERKICKRRYGHA